MKKLDVLDDDDDVPSDELVSFRPFYTDPAASWATNGLYRGDCEGGMYLDSDRLYRSSHTYVIRTVRLNIRYALYKSQAE